MDTHNPYPFRSTTQAVGQHVSVAWRQQGIGSKIAAIVITLALLIFLVFVALPLGIILAVTVLSTVTLRRLATRARAALGLNKKRDAQGRRNVRVIERPR